MGFRLVQSSVTLSDAKPHCNSDGALQTTAIVSQTPWPKLACKMSTKA